MILNDHLMRYFSLSCYNKMGNHDGGFYEVYRSLFQRIYMDERAAVEKDPEALGHPIDNLNCTFGDSETRYDPCIKLFYNAFVNFSTVRSFFWVDEFKLFEIDDRRVRRIAESKNNKSREGSRKEYNETVRSLALYLQKRDPRYKIYKEYLKDKSAALYENIKAKKQDERVQRQKLAASFQEAEWTKVKADSELDEDWEEDILYEIFECVVCNKIFKSDMQLVSHEKSKKHKENLKLLRKEMLLDVDDHLNSDLSVNLFANISTSLSSDQNVDENLEMLESLHLNGISNDVIPVYPKVLSGSTSPDSISTGDQGSLRGITPQDPPKAAKKKRRASKDKSCSSAPKEFKCNSCSESFASRTKLFEHVRNEGHAQHDSVTSLTAAANGKKKKNSKRR